MIIDLQISDDPSTLGDNATRDDLDAYASQLGRELGDACGCAVRVATRPRHGCRASGPDRDTAARVADLCREWQTGDYWIEVLSRALAGVTDDQIHSLRSEAVAANDQLQVRFCDEALAGDDRARALCADAIRDGYAMHD